MRQLSLLLLSVSLIVFSANFALGCEYCGSYTQYCTAYTQQCDSTSQVCDSYSTVCTSTSQVCDSYSTTCSSYSTQCDAYDDDGNCVSYSTYCSSYSQTCDSYSTVCNSYGQQCNSYSTVCNSYSQHCTAYQQVCDSYYYGEYVTVNANVKNSGNGAALSGIGVSSADLNSSNSNGQYSNASGNASYTLFAYDDAYGNISLNTTASGPQGYQPPSTSKSNTFADRCDNPSVNVSLSLAPPSLGSLDLIVSGGIRGWALDPSSPQTSIAVHIYADGPAGAGGTFVGSTTANLSRPDINNAFGYPGNHGFQFNLPANYLNSPHQFYGYAIAVSSGYNTLLSNSPLAYQGSLSGIAHIIATGTDSGPAGHVKIFDANNLNVLFQTNPYGNFTGGIRVAVADVNHDGVLDVVTAAGPGGGPVVTVYSGDDGHILYNFLAYDPSFRNGLFVATGDVDGDGYADIITTPDNGGGPNVRVFSGKTGAMIQNFMALDPNFRGGLRVASGDVDADGFSDIIVTPGVGGGPVILVFSGKTNAQIRSFFALDPNFRLGLHIAAGDFDGDGYADIITGVDNGGGPHVQAFSGRTGAQLASFFAYSANFRGGVRVAGADLNGDGKAEIITAAGPSGGPHVEVFDAVNLGHLLQSFYAEVVSFANGVFVSAK